MNHKFITVDGMDFKPMFKDRQLMTYWFYARPTKTKRWHAVDVRKIPGASKYDMNNIPSDTHSKMLMFSEIYLRALEV